MTQRRLLRRATEFKRESRHLRKLREVALQPQLYLPLSERTMKTVGVVEINERQADIEELFADSSKNTDWIAVTVRNAQFAR